MKCRMAVLLAFVLVPFVSAAAQNNTPIKHVVFIIKKTGASITISASFPTQMERQWHHLKRNSDSPATYVRPSAP